MLPNFPDPLKPGACSLCQLPSWPRPRRQIWVLDRIQDRIPRLARERGRGLKATSLASQVQLRASVIGGHRAPGPKQRYRPLPGLGQLKTQALSDSDLVHSPTRVLTQFGGGRPITPRSFFFSREGENPVQPLFLQWVRVPQGKHLAWVGLGAAVGGIQTGRA